MSGQEVLYGVGNYLHSWRHQLHTMQLEPEINQPFAVRRVLRWADASYGMHVNQWPPRPVVYSLLKMKIAASGLDPCRPLFTLRTQRTTSNLLFLLLA